MKQHKLEMYKMNRIKFLLQRSELDHDGNLILHFMQETPLVVNDLIWAEDDLVKLDSDQMLVVKEILPNLGVMVRRPEGAYVVPQREFQSGERFELVASYREFDEEE